MLYKGIEIEEANLVLYLGEKAKEDWKENEWYVLNKLDNLGFEYFRVENPVDDLVYLYFDKKDWFKETEELSEIYEIFNRIFDKCRINLYLDDYIDDEGNSIDLTIEEYLELLNSQRGEN